MPTAQELAQQYLNNKNGGSGSQSSTPTAPNNSPMSGSNALQQLAQQYMNNKNTPKGDATFGVVTGQQSINDQLNAMPNSNKLTNSERWIYGFLPGVTTWMENTHIMGNTVSEHLDRFNNSWQGKALNKLDILAEGLERTSGLIDQIATDKNFNWDQLQQAWYAGSLAYDMSNLPQLKRDKDGKIIGVTINGDLPGSGGLNNARATIAKYMSQGMSASDALAKTRDEYYTGLGALALRAQINDTWGHVLLDPLNVLTGALKPIEALKVARFNALGKISGGAEEVLQDVERVSKLAHEATDLQDVYKFTEEAYKLSQMAGDVEKTAQYAEEAATLAKQLGRTEDAARYVEDVAKFAGMTAEEAATYTDDALKMLGKKTLTSQDKFIIMATGGDPFRPSEFGKKFENVPILGKIAKEFQLTPESKAKELMTLMSDNYRVVAGRLMNDLNTEEEFVKYAARVGQGATGIEYGHSMMTVQGRTVQAFSKGVETDLMRMLDQYKGTQTTRELLQMMSETLGESSSKLLSKMDENPGAVLQMLAKYADTNPALALRLQQLDEDGLRSVSKILKDVPYNKEMFIAQSLDAIESHAMRQAVIQFGVKEKGVLTRWSDAIKAAESIAFLKLNPGYPIRNKINNDLTMISRGLFGFMPEDKIDDFWKAFGYAPQRLGSGVTPIGEKTVEQMSEAERYLQKVLDGGGYSTPDQVKKFFSKVDLGKMDFAGYWGQRIEQRASRKAFTLGTKQGLDIFSKQVNMTDHFAPGLLKAMDDIDPTIADKIQDAIRSSDAIDAKFTELLGTNLNTNVDTILNGATDALGYEVRDFMGDELVQHLRDTLPDAIKSGSVDALKGDIRAGLEKHIDDLFQKNLDNLVEETKTQVMAGGPNVWNKKLLESRDMFYSARIEYSIRMSGASKLASEATTAGDRAAARALWAQEALDGRLYHDRLFKRMDAIIDGMEQGAKELGQRGANLPFAETKKTFKAFKSNWEGFFKEKEKLVTNFWEAVDKAPKGEQPVWNEVHTRINQLYDAAVKKEDDLVRKLDDHVAGMIDNPEFRASYMSARDELMRLNTIDKNAVKDVFEASINAAPEDRQSLWNQFWSERAKRYKEIRNVDAQSIAIQQGDPRALDAFPPKPVPISRITTTPRGELPPEVSQKFADTARRYIDELSAGQAGNRGRAAKFRRGEALSGFGTTNPEFYKSINAEFGYNKPTVRKALEKIIADEGKDKGVIVERVKEMIYQEMKFGDPTTGTPPDLYSLQQMGASEKTMNEALNNFNDITNSSYTLDQAINASAPTRDITQNITDVTQPYYNAAGELVKPNFIADVNGTIPRMAPMDLGLDEMTYGRIQNTLDEVVNSAKKAASEKPLLLQDLPPEMQAKVQQGLDSVRNELSDVRYKSMKFGEWRRDAALLNYNRRTNFDNQLGHIAPFVYWTTASIQQWAIESIDRPAMLTNYLRAKKFLDTAGMQRDGMPSRIKGKIRINLPFAPDWMGEQFIDPLRVALPFDNWAAPFEQYQKDQQGFNGRVDRVLQTMLQEGKITQDEYDQAVNNQSGPNWDYAEATTKQNDSGEQYDAWDFATSLASPHAPIMWAYNAAFGDKQDIGPFAPASRLFRNAATLLGVEDWNNSKWNLEAKVRKQMGLPAFDKWDDYRIKRAASDLAGEGKLTPDEAKEAIAVAALVEQGKMTPEDAKNQSEAYKMSVARSNQEYTGGVGGFIGNLLGLSITSVPAGENMQRKLQNDFGIAYDQYKQANDSLNKFQDDHPDMTAEEANALWEKQNPQLAKGADALSNFFDAHPEYETRLGLFDKPEEQVHKFMIDQIWKTWNELPKVNQDEVKDHLGINFQEGFLNKDTRSYDSIPTETMAVWLKMMNVDPLGGLTADQRLLYDLYGKVQFTNPEMANRVQVFYDTRKNSYPDYYDKQSAYYKIQSKAQRKQYLAQNQDLKQYWDWRRQFMTDNPDLVPYLTDNQNAIDEAKNKYRNVRSVPTAQEIQSSISPTMGYFLQDYYTTGTALPQEAQDYLSMVGDAYGLNGDQILNILGGGQGIP